ncbi:MAG: putative metalloprotease CJM1_0395 family protein [Pseudomonadota bacterium]
MAIGAIGASTSAYASAYVRPAQPGGQEALSLEQQQQVAKLKATDAKVRAHEAAHMAAGAGLTSGANFVYTRGPDGKQYAVGGEVKIDVSPGQTPQQTLEKARRIQAAALAPADPSPQDRAVAAQAAQMAQQARMELMQQRQAESEGQAPVNPALAAYGDLAPKPEATFSVVA